MNKSNFKKRKPYAVFDKYKNRGVARRRQIYSIPRIFDFEDLLYVGASPARFELVDLFFYTGYKIDVLEIWKPNVQALDVMNRRWKIFNKIMLGDVRNVEQILQHRYDVIVFWHGPEHLGLLHFASTMRKLGDFAKHLLICGCPWGDYPQGAVKGNEYEKHLSSLFPEDFKKLGFETSTIRKPGRGSNLLAWKKTD